MSKCVFIVEILKRRCNFLTLWGSTCSKKKVGWEVIFSAAELGFAGSGARKSQCKTYRICQGKSNHTLARCVFFWLSSKNWQNGSRCKVGFDISPLQALNLSPLAWEVDLLPTRAEVYDLSWVLHCFDVALPNQHFTYWWFFKSTQSDQATILWMIHW